MWETLNYTQRAAGFFFFLTTELLRASNMLKTTVSLQDRDAGGSIFSLDCTTIWGEV